MTFIHPLLLGGLVLAGVPILLHLIMRQKPKRLAFPAMRFLVQKHRSNQRKHQLRHLLLLALRMLLIAVICLALARPRVFSPGLQLEDRPVAAVFIFDCSYSMEYVSGGRSRLEEAKQQGQDILTTLPPGSKVAVLDTGGANDSWLPSVSSAHERIAGLEVRPNSVPLSRPLAHAFDLLGAPGEGDNGTQEMPIPFVYVFSDRTVASWDTSRVQDLQRLRDRMPPPGPYCLYIDVGVDAPVDLAISRLELPHQVLSANQPFIVRAAVQATGSPFDQEILFRIDGETSGERKPVRLEAGKTAILTFQRQGLAPGPHQVELSLASTDALAFNNKRYASFEVRKSRRILTVVDELRDADYWALALKAKGEVDCVVKTVVEIKSWDAERLLDYQAVCLLNVASPDPDLWLTLDGYVQKGGSLGVVPGGQEINRGAYNSEAAQRLLPGRMVGVITHEENADTFWGQPFYQHPLLIPFKEWSISENLDFLEPGRQPKTNRYWEVGPRGPEATVLVPYADGKPALLERKWEGEKGRGRVLLFTTPLDRRHVARNQLDPRDPLHRAWNDYLLSPFYMVFVNLTATYLAGNTEEANFNYQSGQAISVVLPAKPRDAVYTLQGPGLSGAETTLTRTEGQAEVHVNQAIQPGNYAVLATGDQPWAGFSVNILSEESNLQRVPPEEIEKVLGAGALLRTNPNLSLRDALQSHWSQPLELMPLLMIFLLFVLALESFLANRFYRGESKQPVSQA